MEKDIKKYQEKLLKLAKSKGLFENFGQKEVRLLTDKYGYTPEVRNFDNWCMDLDLTNITFLNH